MENAQLLIVNHALFFSDLALRRQGVSILPDYDAVIIDEEEKSAIVVVPDRALSLAIGREGQNARLAAKLTDWRIDIKSASEHAEPAEPKAETPPVATEITEAVSEIVAAVEAAPDTEVAPVVAVEAPEAPTVTPEPAAEPIAAEATPPIEKHLEPELAAVADLAPELESLVAEQPAAVLETEPVSEVAAVPALPSPEEALALQVLEEEIVALEKKENEEAAAAAEAEQIIDFGSEDIWQLPSSVDDENSGSLRFAEDIIGYRDQGGSRRRGRGRRGGENLSAKARRAVARKTTTQPPSSEDNARTSN